MIEHNRVHINCMLFASEEKLSRTFLQICRGTVLESDVGELSCRECIDTWFRRTSNGYFGGQAFTDIRMHFRYEDPNTYLSPFLN